MNRRRPWLDRDQQIRDAATELERQHVDHKTELVNRIQLLAIHEICAQEAVAWLTSKSGAGRRREITISSNANGKVGEHSAIRLSKLKHLRDEALLTLAVLVESSTKLVRYVVGLQGLGKASGHPWYARIELTEAPEGKGPCGHPLLHCHVGIDPNSDEPKTRVPLPFLTPAEALDWLLATADPDKLEPKDGE